MKTKLTFNKKLAKAYKNAFKTNYNGDPTTGGVFQYILFVVEAFVVFFILFCFLTWTPFPPVLLRGILLAIGLQALVTTFIYQVYSGDSE